MTQAPHVAQQLRRPSTFCMYAVLSQASAPWDQKVHRLVSRVTALHVEARAMFPVGTDLTIAYFCGEILISAVESGGLLVSPTTKPADVVAVGMGLCNIAKSVAWGTPAPLATSMPSPCPTGVDKPLPRRAPGCLSIPLVRAVVKTSLISMVRSLGAAPAPAVASGVAQV